MAEIYVGSNFPTRTTIFYAGELYSATGYVTAKIYDITEDPAVSPPINPGTLIYETTAVELETDPGTYQIVLPLSLTTRQREFKIVWEYQVELNGNQEIVQHVSHLDVVTPYVDVTELMQDLNLGLDQSDPNYKTYHELIMAEKYARRIIDSYCGQSFSLYDDVQVAWGAGTDILALPFKLAELHELYADDYLLVDNINNINNWGYTPIISESGFGIRVNMQSMMDNTIYVANGQVPPTVNDVSYRGVFKNGVRYRIQGKFGWDDVPENVEEAATLLVADYFSKDSKWRNKYINRISTFDWNFEYFDDVFRGTGNLTVDQLLQPYVITGMVVI